MTTHVHVLRGCATAPLAHYLKALGVFRLVAEQCDENARSFWKDDVFHLVTTLDAEELARFFCDEFSPTPLLSPWNGGSGFYTGHYSTAVEALATLARSTHPRLAGFRRALAFIRPLLPETNEAPGAKGPKEAFVATLRSHGPDDFVHWIDAAIQVVGPDRLETPSLLGTGGNDGNLDFSVNYALALLQLINPETGTGTPVATSLLAAALLGDVRLSVKGGTASQLLPGSLAGNPWDFVLMLEGALLLCPSTTRRTDSADLPRAAAPFAFRAIGLGYGSAGADDEGSKENRGEQWFPIWSRPATLLELSGLFNDGRVRQGSRAAKDGYQAVRGVAALGVARGVEKFVRFGYLKRNGKTFFAVPLEEVHVRNAPSAVTRLLDEIDPWLDALRRAAREDHAPKAYARAVRDIQTIGFELCRLGNGNERRWGDLVGELGFAEDELVRTPKNTAKARLQPLPRLSSRWLEASNDGTAEYRLARALAAAHAPFRPGSADELGPIRAHCLPLDPASRFSRFLASSEGLRNDPRVVWGGRDLAQDLTSIVLRRAMEGARAGFDGLPLEGVAHASLDDILAFLNGTVDDARIARLARGLMAVTPAPMLTADHEKPFPLYALFRVANLDTSERTRTALPSGVGPRCDTQTLRLLAAGRLDEAARVALARLGAMGLRPKLRHTAGDARLSLRLAASLAFPIGPRAVRRVLDAVTQPFASQPSEMP